MWCLICPSCFDCGNHLLRICWLFLSNGIWTWMISNPHAIFSNVKHLLSRPTCMESVWAIWLDLTKRSLGSCSVGGFARRSTWSSGLSPLIELASFVFLACVLLMKAIGNFNNSKVSSKRLRVDYSIVLKAIPDWNYWNSNLFCCNKISRGFGAGMVREMFRWIWSLRSSFSQRSDEIRVFLVVYVFICVLYISKMDHSSLLLKKEQLNFPRLSFKWNIRTCSQ